MTDTIPKSGEYQSGKGWFERRGEVLTIGLTSRAIEEIGQIEEIEFPDDGADYDKGEAMLRIEGSRGAIDLLAPAAGIVEEINPKAKDEPETVAEDPFEEGWLVRLEIQDPTDLADQGEEEYEDEDEDYEGEGDFDVEDDYEEEDEDEDEDEDDEDLESLEELGESEEDEDEEDRPKRGGKRSRDEDDY